MKAVTLQDHRVRKAAKGTRPLNGRYRSAEGHFAGTQTRSPGKPFSDTPLKSRLSEGSEILSSRIVHSLVHCNSLSTLLLQQLTIDVYRLGV